MNDQDRFFFYSSSIGDLTKLMKKYSATQLTATPGFITNAFGVKINPKHLPHILSGREGVEPLPIPSNWHADIAEFGGALRAVDLAKGEFTVVELGCGWGCWLNITGVVARRKGLNVKLIGVEGDAGHVVFAKESLTENGFSENQFTIFHGIASAKEGFALFPIQGQSGIEWGLEALFDLSLEKSTSLLKTGKYQKLRQISLYSILENKYEKIDLLHIDIQGAELSLIEQSIVLLNKKVGMILIGTHSRQIEGKLFDCLFTAGWTLEVERPAILNIGKNAKTVVDGVQLWRNSKLIPDSESVVHVDPFGEITIIEVPGRIKRLEKFKLKVMVTNESDTNWMSRGIEYPVSLSYHWLTENDHYLVYDGIRTSFIDGVLEARNSITQIMQVEPPNHRGKIKLIVTVVQDGVRWFENLEFKSATIDIDIL